MTSAVATLTIETAHFPPEERTARVFAAFDSLSPGERFLLRFDRAPRPILESLQKERRGLFEWSLVATGAGSWTIEVFRREAAGSPLREVTEALAWDHDRLDALEAAAFVAVYGGDGATATKLYAEFACGLERHIGFEEDVLFPVFERKAGLDSTCGPTAVMRQEHAEIRFLLHAIGQSIGRPATDLEPLRRRFHDVIGEHNEKEEAILYPGTDRMLTPEESDAVVRQIQRYGM
jgi:uncharacterized protein (DUF2249 family)/hemerythrin-like domain-containing protein